MMHVAPLQLTVSQVTPWRRFAIFFDFSIDDWFDITMEELLVKKFEEVKKIMTIIKPLPEMGYDIGYGESIVPDEMRKTYR